ncbi:MAG: phosphohistidine phosphatase [Chitinophagaceae bacterium]
MQQHNDQNSPLGVRGKTLLLIRHAKSSWDDPSQPDFERPLNERGKRDAPEMAKKIKKKVQIDAFVSSPAKRAKKTCQAFAEAFKFNKDNIIYKDELYEAIEENFLNVIESFDDDLETVAVFSHNPGITDFANLLSDEVRIDNMPTCSVFAVKLHTNRWADIRQAKREFMFFDSPKGNAD